MACLEADFGQVRAWLEEVVEDKIALEAYILELQVTTLTCLFSNLVFRWNLPFTSQLSCLFAPKLCAVRLARPP